VCSAQVTHLLNLGAAIKVTLTAPGRNLSMSMGSQTRRFVWYHRVKMPRQSLAQAFGLWRSGKFTNGTPGAALRGSHQLGKIPIWSFLTCNLPYIERLLTRGARRPLVGARFGSSAPTN
jgi:hypothetical protein